eukprot:GDKK01064105.1.p1 GENE.GDKK01064105.1~~GDKK01064105.1.p1  ORF type:complete len:283 (+),score=66.81 GDKK01064105.1:89-850(+)
MFTSSNSSHPIPQPYFVSAFTPTPNRSATFNLRSPNFDSPSIAPPPTTMMSTSPPPSRALLTTPANRAVQPHSFTVNNNNTDFSLTNGYQYVQPSAYLPSVTPQPSVTSGFNPGGQATIKRVLIGTTSNAGASISQNHQKPQSSSPAQIEFYNQKNTASIKSAYYSQVQFTSNQSQNAAQSRFINGSRAAANVMQLSANEEDLKGTTADSLTRTLSNPSSFGFKSLQSSVTAMASKSNDQSANCFLPKNSFVN